MDGVPCKIYKHPKYNCSRGLIYVHEFGLENVQDFKNGLQSTYNVVDVQPATFIKTRSPQTRVFIVTFQQEHLPYSIYIPGERQDTRVFKLNSKPLMCYNCLQYGHARKYCRRQEATCGKYSSVGHSRDQCTNKVVMCVHCNEAHMLPKFESIHI